MRILSIVCIVAIMLPACKKDHYTPDYSDGRIWGLKNGVNWEAEAYASNYNGRIVIVISRKNDQGFDREGMTIDLLPLTTGELQLYDHTQVMFGDSLIRASYETVQGDGDVLEDSYKIIESAPKRFVKISKISNDKKWLEGEVSCSFVLMPPKINLNNPDTLVFQDCRFKVKRIK
ncbi:MAG: hypothetical protein ACOYPR_04775 [Saprospiraceae bacterium]